MSRPYANPLQLDIGPSLYFKFYCLLFYLLLITAIFNYPVSWLIRCILCVFVSIFLLMQFKKHNTGHRIIWADENHWTIETNHNQVIAQLKPDSFISSLLMVLNFEDEAGKRFNILLFIDSLNVEQWRRLRVRLKVDNPVFKNMLE